MVEKRTSMEPVIFLIISGMIYWLKKQQIKASYLYLQKNNNKWNLPKRKPGFTGYCFLFLLPYFLWY